MKKRNRRDENRLSVTQTRLILRRKIEKLFTEAKPEDKQKILSVFHIPPNARESRLINRRGPGHPVVVKVIRNILRRSTLAQLERIHASALREIAISETAIQPEPKTIPEDNSEAESRVSNVHNFNQKRDQLLKKRLARQSQIIQRLENTLNQRDIQKRNMATALSKAGIEVQEILLTDPLPDKKKIRLITDLTCEWFELMKTQVIFIGKPYKGSLRIPFFTRKKNEELETSSQKEASTKNDHPKPDNIIDNEFANEVKEGVEHNVRKGFGWLPQKIESMRLDNEMKKQDIAKAEASARIENALARQEEINAAREELRFQDELIEHYKKLHDSAKHFNAGDKLPIEGGLVCVEGPNGKEWVPGKDIKSLPPAQYSSDENN
jgi:hypothetical protein